MSQLEEVDDFYEAGRKLSGYIVDSMGKHISTATLQALIRDILPQHEELQEALRSIVTRPDFLQLVQLANSENGLAKKCAFVESLRKIYSGETVVAADSLACGMMGLSEIPFKYESEEKKIVVDTFPLQRKGSEVRIETQGENSSEKNFVQGKSSEVAANLSQVALSQIWQDLPQQRNEESSKAEGSFISTKKWVTPRRVVLGSAVMGLCIIAGLSIKPGIGNSSLSCGQVAAKAAALPTNTSKFMNLIMDNKSRCMNDDSFLSQYYREKVKGSIDCIPRADGSCIY